jgi:hypothetical protein
MYPAKGVAKTRNRKWNETKHEMKNGTKIRKMEGNGTVKLDPF